jgi:hypothetical protein
MTATKNKAKCTPGAHKTPPLDEWARLAERAIRQVERGARDSWGAPWRVRAALYAFRLAVAELQQRRP